LPVRQQPSNAADAIATGEHFSGQIVANERILKFLGSSTNRPLRFEPRQMPPNLAAVDSVATRVRARALQILYAWELQGASPMHDVATGIARITGPEPSVFDGAELLATAVMEDGEVLDREAEDATDNWRLDRIAVVERIILRMGIHELRTGDVPPKVAIDEAVRLAHWFGGARAPAFVNGVLDRVAHTLGRL